MTVTWRRRRAVALLALATVVVLLAGAASARAGTYDVWSCRGPDGLPAPTEGWTLSSRDAAPGEVVLADDCDVGQGLDVAVAAGLSIGAEVTARATFTAPPGSVIVGYELRRSLQVAPTLPTGITGHWAVVRERTTSGESAFGCATTLLSPIDACTSRGSPTDPDDPDNLHVRSGVALTALELEAACISAGCLPLMPEAQPAAVRLHGARITLRDDDAPARPELTGSLVAGRPLTGEAILVVESRDDGGGIAAVTFAVDGGPPQIAAPAGPGGRCRQPYTAPRPCPAAVARAFALDATTLAPGSHTASGTVVDAAGNATSWGPIPFTVAHRAPSTPGGGGSTPPPATGPLPPAGGGHDATRATNGVPAVERPRLRLDRTRVVRRAGRPARLTGTVRTRAGVPIVGARLETTVEPLGVVAPRPRPSRSVRTDRRGRFAVAVRGGGPQRVVVTYAPRVGAAATAVARATVSTRARLTVGRSRARLRRGEVVTLAGRLHGAGQAARGTVVELQAIVSGGWRTVGTVQADARGRYRWRYRFVRVTRDTIFSFRALVRRTPGWPLPPQRSRVVTVRVDGR